jgi:hypothetical protein
MRNGTDPNTKINWMGFRCARSVEWSSVNRQSSTDRVDGAHIARTHE